MTSISGSTSSADRMQLMLQQMVSAGSVKSADQGALSSALDDIKTAMTSGSGTAATSPTDMKSKVDGLVDQEVTDGKLTSDQATELKSVFAQAAQKMGHHHHGPPPPSDDDSSTDDSSVSATGATGSTSSTTDSLTSSIETLISFLKKMETATSSATNYTASGTNTSSATQSLLVNLTA